MEIENAKITNVSLSMADHGCLTFYITVEGSGWGCGVGGYCIAHGALGWKKEDFKAKTGAGLVAIMRIMDVIGVEKWENLKGKYCRVKTTGWGGTINEIGNITEDKWFNLKEFFEEASEKVNEEVNVLASEWKPLEEWKSLEGRGVYECENCGKLVDIPTQYCPDCGSYMSNFNYQEV